MEEPLVGRLVLEKKERTAPLSLFMECCLSPYISDLIPVGSKGILEELKVLTGQSSLRKEQIALTISGGPPTCFIIKFKSGDRSKAAQMDFSRFYPLLVKV
jgi:hypothetical protein